MGTIAAMSVIIVINGPNLNLLGIREPELYGHDTLETIIDKMSANASMLGHNLQKFQSNAEHELISKIQEIRGKVDFIIINPAALTHTSIALRDTLLAVNIPFIELHLTNTDRREEFRKISYLADIALGQICGFGAYGYQLALMAADHYLKNKRG